MQNNYQQYLISLAPFMNQNFILPAHYFPFQFTPAVFETSKPSIDDS
jgi:hypothetical protein